MNFPNYQIRVNSTLNRMHLVLNGFWKSIDDVPAYCEDFGKALSRLKPGFTILADLRDFSSSVSVAEVHVKVQTLAVKSGLSKTAEVIKKNNAIAKMATDNYSKNSGMKHATFTSIEEAEKWLA